MPIHADCCSTALIKQSLATETPPTSCVDGYELSTCQFKKNEGSFDVCLPFKSKVDQAVSHTLPVISANISTYVQHRPY